MPAQSKQQQKLFGLALSVKRGDTPRSEASKEVLKIVDTMTEKEIEDFAGTEHKGLPKKVEQKIREMARQTIRERMMGEAKFNRGDMVRVIDNPKYVMDKKKFAGKSGYVKNIMGRDVMVKFPNGRTILVDPKDLEMNPNESVNDGSMRESKPPKGVNLSIVDKEIKRRGKANMLKHFKDIKKNKLYTKVNTPKSIDYLINYVSNFNESVNLSIVDKEIKRRGKANMLKHFKDIKKNKLYTKVNTPKSIDYLINYVSNFKESVNETSGEFVVYVEKDNGRKKLLHTKKSQRAANMFMSKNMDKILNTSGIRSIGSMSKDQWEKKEAQFAENIKKKGMKTVTKKEWDRTHKDYKGMIKGQPYMMWFDKQTQSTVYGPVHIKD